MAFMISYFLTIFISTTISMTPTTIAHHRPNSETTLSTTISAAPALLPNPPLSTNPYTELPPEIAPLLPSPRNGSTVPTIPSDHSPPNPDTVSSVIGPDTAFSPTGSLQDSSDGSDICIFKGLKVEVLTGLWAYFLAMVLFHGYDEVALN